MNLHHSEYFDDKTPLYASARPRYPDALFEFLVAQCADLNCVWDCATGSGQAAWSLAKYFQRVEATDISAAQIAQAVARDKIRYSVQTAEHTGFADDTFSLITVAQALHWFEFDAFWPEVQRVLKAGGLFAAWAYTWCRIDGELDGIVRRLLLEKIVDFWAPQNKLAWDGYRDLAFPFAKIEAPVIELNLQWDLDQLLSYFATWSAVRRYDEAHGGGCLKPLAAGLREVWGPRGEKKNIAMDFHLYVGRCEK